MIKSNLTRRVARAAAVTTAGLLTLPLLTSTPAHADPKQFSALAGFGSDTSQFVMDAMAGESNGALFNAIRSNAHSGNQQVTSWSATPANTCVTPKAPGATIFRPTGSGAGLKSLSRAIDGGKWGDTSAAAALCGGTSAGKAVSGLVDFARSSRGPLTTETGTDLTYIPFARDGVSYAYYAQGTAAKKSSFTQAQLSSLFATGPASFTADDGTSSVTVVPCQVQLNSGTGLVWMNALGLTQTQINTGTVGTGKCSADTSTGGTTGLMVENDSTALKARGDALAGNKEYITSMGSGPFISQWKGVATNQTSPSVALGAISDDGAGHNIGKPYTNLTDPTTIPTTLTPNTNFYGNGVFGRDIYTVIDSLLLSDSNPLVNENYKTLFVGPTSAICDNNADAIVQNFGFLLSANCGSTSLQGGSVAGGH